MRTKTLLLAGLLCGCALSVISLYGVPQGHPAHAPAAESTFNAADDPGKTLAPYFQVISGDPSAVFPLQNTDVDVKISGTVADVIVEQVYVNRSAQPIEAKYVFPASTRAAVHGLEMLTGGRVIRAKIEESKKAHATYEKAKAEHKTAALLKQERPNVFQMSVANIASGEEVRVKLHYTETVPAVDRVYEFVFPTVIGPRYSETPRDSAAGQADEWVENPVLQKPEPGADTAAAIPPCEVRVQLNAGMPVSGLQCSTHATDITFTDAASAAVRMKPGVAAGAGDRDYVLRYQLADQKVASGLLLHKGTEENFFCLTVQPPRRVQPAQIPPREYLFVVDVSGSMAGFPLDTAKTLMRELLQGMGSADTFNVMLFAGGSEMLAPSQIPATPQNITSAMQLLDRNDGRGGTRLLPALEQAFRTQAAPGRSRSVVLVTDGFVDVERASFDLVRTRLGQANFFSFGIGSSVNRFLVEGLARAGRGEPAVILEPSQAAAAARRFREYISAPVLTGVKVEFDGLNVSGVEPAAVPDVFADRPVQIFGKWSGEPKGMIRLSGMSGDGPVSVAFDVAAEAAKGLENPALRTLWARERIRTLGDYQQIQADSELQREITSLGLTYSLLTEFTSFIAVDEVVRPELANAQTVQQPGLLPQGVPTSAVSGPAPTMATVVAAAGTPGSTPEPGGVLLLSLTALMLLGSRRR